MTCMKLLASSIPGRVSANSVISSFANPDNPAEQSSEYNIVLSLLQRAMSTVAYTHSAPAHHSVVHLHPLL